MPYSDKSHTSKLIKEGDSVDGADEAGAGDVDEYRVQEEHATEDKVGQLLSPYGIEELTAIAFPFLTTHAGGSSMHSVGAGESLQHLDTMASNLFCWINLLLALELFSCTH